MNTPVKPAVMLAEEWEIVRETFKRKRGDFFRSLEDLLTSVDGFGLTTATPLQRAICRIAQGAPLGELSTNPDIIECVGEVAHLRRPGELVIISGIRGGKSLIASAMAVWASQTCDMRRLGPGEIPRVSVVSITKDLANVVFRHLVGNIVAQKRLSVLLLDNPTSDAVLLRHPSGRPVEIKVVAGSKAGASLVARWSAGCIFDEAPRMAGQEDGVVNLEDAKSAILGRLLPGAQLVEIGSPWAPLGPIYELVQARWKNPTDQTVVIKAPATLMNPVWWTPERCAELQKSDPVAYQTDVLAQFADAEETLFPARVVESCTRAASGDLPYSENAEYVAAMDPATRGNGWTLIIATRGKDGVKRVATAQQWVGSRMDPLHPKLVLKEIANALGQYGLNWCMTDQYASDALRDIASDMNITLAIEDWTAKKKVQHFTSLATEMQSGRIEIPPDPILAKDLKVVRRRVIQNGVAIILPKTPDGRHADYAAALAMAMSRWIDEPVDDIPKPRTPEYAQWEIKRMLDQDDDNYSAEKAKPWWDK